MGNIIDFEAERLKRRPEYAVQSFMNFCVNSICSVFGINPDDLEGVNE